MNSTTKRTKKISPEQIASNARIAKSQAEAQGALQANRCPACGCGVTRNLSITGWVQCEQFGAPQFRKRPTDAPCNWQGFTC
jgi:hypothetical protein